MTREQLLEDALTSLLIAIDQKTLVANEMWGAKESDLEALKAKAEAALS